MTVPGRGEEPQVGARAGMRAVVPLLPAVAAFGVSYGVLAQTAGMGAIAPVVMSATTFAGSAQFAVASILAGGGSAAAAVLAAIFLNTRYAPMSIAVAPAIGGPWWRRVLTAQLVVDESWALALRPGGRFHLPTLIGAGAVLFPCWVVGTAAGVLAGDLIGDPERLGLDAAFPALFLALLAPQLRRRGHVTTAATGAAVALALVPFVPAGIPIVAGSAACLLGLRR
jgi:4-azaleucine resistance transporter AzlC